MIKAIPFREVRVGDVVCEKEDKPLVIEKVVHEDWGKVTLVALWIKNGPILRGEKKTIIGLLHRPYPEGKTEEDMLADVGLWATAVSEWAGVLSTQKVASAMNKLREAQDAYELGKPFDSAQGKPTE